MTTPDPMSPTTAHQAPPSVTKSEVEDATKAVLASFVRPNAKAISINPRPSAAQKTAAERKLGGRYRIIHGNFAVPIPLEQRLLPNGEENPYLPRQMYLKPGDVVELDDQDAASGLDSNVIEPLTTNPSRVDKVWKAPDLEKAKRPWDYAAVRSDYEARGVAR